MGGCNPSISHIFKHFEDIRPPLHLGSLGYMGVSLNGGTPKTPQTDHF